MKFARAASFFESFWMVGFGPVFQKEVFVAGRRTSTYVVRASVALLLFGVLVISCLPLAFESSYNQGVVRLQQSQQFATILTGVVIGFDFAILFLFTPILLVPSVMEEVQKRTLPALLTTPISAAQIITGKLLGRGVGLIVLALIPMPILLVLRSLGGVPGDAILASIAMLLSATLLIGSVSMLISVWVRKPASGIVAALVFFAAIQGLPPVLLAIAAKEYHLIHIPDHVLFSLSVFSSAVITLVEKLGGVRIGFADTQDIWIINSVYNLVVALGLLGISVLMLRRVMRKEASGGSFAATRQELKMVNPALLLDPAASPDLAASQVIAASPASRAASRAAVSIERIQREVGDQPVLWREVRQPIFKKRSHWLIACAAIIGLLVLIFFLGGNSPADSMQISLGIALGLALLGAAVLTTSSIGTERDSQTWDVLLTTSLSAHEILWGKFLGILKRQLLVPILGAVFLLLVGAVLLNGVHPAEILLWLFQTLGPICFLSATGIFFSLYFRKSTVAAVWNIILALSLWVALPAIIGLTCYPFERYLLQLDSVVSDRLLTGALLINPVVCFAITMGGVDFTEITRWGTGTEVRFPTSIRFSLYEFLAISAAVFAAYCASAWGVLYLAKALFPYFSGRVGTPSHRD